MHVIDGKLLPIFVGIQQIFICFDDKINRKRKKWELRKTQKNYFGFMPNYF